MKTFDNEITGGFSGKLKYVVFKQWYGQTIAGKNPRKRSKAPTAAMEEVKATFKRAVTYAKAAIKDLATKLGYEKKAKPGQTAYNLAIADYFTPPEIGEIDSSNYTAQVGSIIRVPVTDDFQVAGVHIKIEKADGSLLEQGNASADADGLHWRYSASVSNSSMAGSSITVSASDLPGNQVVKQKMI